MLTGPLLEFAPVDHSRFKLEASVDLDDEELAGIAGPLDLHSMGGFFGGDGFDFNQVIAEAAIRTLGVGLVERDAVLDLSVELAEFAPNFQVAAGESVVVPGVLDQVFKQFSEVGGYGGVCLTQLIFVELAVNPVPADPFSVVVDALGGVAKHLPSHCAAEHVCPLGFDKHRGFMHSMAMLLV